MGNKRKAGKPRAATAAAPVHGASPKDVTITIEGKEYHLVFSFKALEIAEMRLAEAKHHVNMLLQMDPTTVGATRLPFLFFAALVTNHPEVTFAQAREMINFRTAMPIHNAVMDTYVAAMVQPKAGSKEGDPTPEPAAK